MRKPKNKNKEGKEVSVSHAPRLQRFSLPKSDPQALKREISTLTQTESLENIIKYGPDNAFPLRIAQSVEDSPSGSSCVGTVAQFIKGSGFSDKELMKIPVDKDGTTLWDLHSRLSDSMALFWGFAVNLKYDERARITNAFQTSFENCRFVAPGEKSPTITTIKYNPYWGTSEYKEEYTTKYPVFNVKDAQKQIAGFKTKEEKNSYAGQIYYYGKTSPLSRFYPKPAYWSAKKWLEIDAKIQGFHAENLDNGFFQSVLMQVVGNPNEMSQNPRTQKEIVGDDGSKRYEPTKTISEEFNEMMTANFSGYQKAGNVFVQWVKNTVESLKIQEFPSRTNADLFTALQDLTTKNITIATKVPSILANISEGVSLGSGGSEMQKAIELMQSNTSEQRTTLENFYNNVLLPNLQEKTELRVKIQNYNPISEPVEIEDKFWEFMNEQEKIAYIKKNLPEIEIIRVETPAPVAPVEGEGPIEGSPVDPLVPAPVAPKPNEALKNLNLTQIKRISKIVLQFNTGALTFDQAKQILMGYGLTEEELNAWLVTPDEI